jgi:hypothetical protein
MPMHNYKRYVLAIVLISTGLVSLFVKGMYVKTIVAEDRYKSISLNSDSQEYIHLAQNIANREGYAQDNIHSRYISVLRTPGYPLFYALIEYIGTAPASILWSQVVLGSCLPVIAALLAYMITRKILASIIAGVLSCLSSSGIFLSSEIMVDLLFAVTFIFGFFLFYIGITNSKQMSIITAGLIFGICSLIKPTTVIWPIYSVIVYYFLAKANQVKIRYKTLICFVLIQIVLIGGWSLRNYHTERIFSLSTIGTQSLRHYLAVAVNEVSKKENSPETIISSIRREQKRLRDEVKFSFNQGVSIKKLHETQFDESLSILFSDLSITYICFIRNVAENIGSSNLRQFYLDELPKQSFLTQLLSKLIFFNSYLLRFIFVVIILFICSLPWLRKFCTHEMLSRHIYTSLALILTYLYFALISGVTFWTGPRIVFPAEFVLFLLLVIIGQWLFYFTNFLLNIMRSQNS